MLAPSLGVTMWDVIDNAAHLAMRVDSRPDQLRQITEEADEPQSEYRLFIWLLCRAFRPAVMIELGANRGTGTAHMALGNPDGIVYSIDHDIGKVHPAVRALPNIVWIEGDTANAATILKLPPLADMIFFDAGGNDQDRNHNGDATYAEYLAYRGLAEDGAILLFDDITLNDGMRNFWKRVNEPKRAYEVHQASHAGFGVALC